MQYCVVGEAYTCQACVISHNGRHNQTQTYICRSWWLPIYGLGLRWLKAKGQKPQHIVAFETNYITHTAYDRHTTSKRSSEGNREHGRSQDMMDVNGTVASA